MPVPRWLRRFLWRSLCILSRTMSRALPMIMPPNVWGRQQMELLSQKTEMDVAETCSGAQV
uniref:Uncharacterized protein n=1 Tax=Setaria viridis TaxID=4556 RepID=A0A4U6UXE4_SETVI|nr:hypothetical protein SEVIR_4G168201v2 [Setaria viridis]